MLNFSNTNFPLNKEFSPGLIEIMTSHILWFEINSQQKTSQLLMLKWIINKWLSWLHNFRHDNMTRYLRILAGPPGQAKRHGQCLRAIRECRSPAWLMFRWDQCFSTFDVFLSLPHLPIKLVISFWGHLSYILTIYWPQSI